MTNLEIAKRLLEEVNQGRLNRCVLAHLVDSLRFGGPVPDPKSWIEGAAKSLSGVVWPMETKQQLLDLATRWN